MNKEQFGTINKKLDIIEEQLKQWQAFLKKAQADGKKTVKLTPTVSYEPDVEVEVKREAQEQINDIKDEAEEINRQIGYAVEAGHIDADEAQNMSIIERKSWLEKNWKDYDSY